ncbi:MAG: glycosyltransferase [Endomicrobiia bacterium]|nr:glycosyltransferase [Endomicrobiia bacterium]
MKEGKEGGLKVRESLNVPENALVVGAVARLEKVKGVEYFVRAAPLVLNAFARSPSSSSSQGRRHSSGDIYFLVVGDGSLKPRLEDIARRLGVGGRVIFAGARDDVYDMLNAMDFYVQPSLNEGMGRTIVEAMYLAKPIVATFVQGIPDLIRDGETGLLSPPANPDALAAAVVRLMNDKTLASRIGRAALDFSTEQIVGGGRFSVERMIYLHEKLYEKIIKKN